MINTADLIEFLTKHAISFQRIDHVPLFTTAQAETEMKGVPGIPSKNLFLEDSSGGLWLLSTTDKKRVDLKRLALLLGVKKFSFASSEKLVACLGVQPGAVTLFGAINDTEQKVSVLIDSEIAEGDTVQCHPLINTATLVLKCSDVLRFFELIQHSYKAIDVPVR